MAGHGGTQREPSLDDPEVVEQGAFTEINIVPLVDIMLVLLVILMAGSTAMLAPSSAGRGTGIRVNLPSGSKAEEVTSISNELVVAVLRTGEIVARGQALSLEELKDLFAQEAARDQSQLVLVQADEEAIHKRVVEVMETARAAGLTNLAIATEPEEP